MFSLNSLDLPAFGVKFTLRPSDQKFSDFRKTSMSNPKSKTFALVLLVFGLMQCLPSRLWAQDVVFSQFYANPLYLNPALAGNASDPRLTFNFRNQWPALNASFVTYSAGFDQHFDALSGGVGLHVLTDQIGSEAFRHTQVALQYAYNLNINRNLALRAGFQYAYANRSLNFNKLTFPEQIDRVNGIGGRPVGSEIPFGSKTVTISDFSAGLVLFSEKFYFGAAAHHLTEPSQAFYGDADAPWPMRISVHTGASIPLSQAYSNAEPLTLSPNVIYIQQGTSSQINVGTYLSKGALSAGLWYRVNDAIIATAGFQRGQMRLGYGYDITTSKLSDARPGGSHEVSLSFVFEKYEPIEKRRYAKVNCPRF
ncbi:MAG: type IX secretion system membrane protein PorP/SprF [Bacteroidetes bacterium]|nr:type IX secretion system membrane protein PorP/SprF [Bacteroidota bacterium]